MSIETPESAVQQPTKVEPQTAEPKPVKVTAPKAPKAKASKPKAATGKGKSAKAPAKVKKPAQSKGKGKATTKTAKPTKAKASKPAKQVKGAGIAIPDISPYRKSSAYAALWAILYNHRDIGIRRDELVKEGVRITGKTEPRVKFDTAVVASPSKDGSAHPSANRAANSYWVERIGDGLLKLHLR